MVNEERVLSDKDAFESARYATLDEIVEELAKKSESSKVLDLATGPGYKENLHVVKTFGKLGKDFQLVQTDISPTWLKENHKNLSQRLTLEEMRKIEYALVDCRDLRKPITEIPLYCLGKEKTFITPQEIISRPEYNFLNSGQTPTFDDNEYSAVIGNIPFSSIHDHRDLAVSETARVLNKDGYLSVIERQVEKINPKVYREPSAMRGAKSKTIEEVRRLLDNRLKPVGVLSVKYEWNGEKIPEQTIQPGDILKDSVLIYKK